MSMIYATTPLLVAPDVSSRPSMFSATANRIYCRLERRPSQNAPPNEGIRERRRSSQISRSTSGGIHTRLPQVFSGSVPGDDEDDEESEGSIEDSEEPAPGFLGRVGSYSRLVNELLCITPSETVLIIPNNLRCMRIQSHSLTRQPQGPYLPTQGPCMPLQRIRCTIIDELRRVNQAVHKLDRNRPYCLPRSASS